MCWLCEKNTKTNHSFIALNSDTIEYSNLELAMCKNMLRARYFNNEGYMVSQDIIPIKYCPYCGKELKFVKTF